MPYCCLQYEPAQPFVLCALGDEQWTQDMNMRIKDVVYMSDPNKLTFCGIFTCFSTSDRFESMKRFQKASFITEKL